jgi:hypothetical protein
MTVVRLLLIQRTLLWLWCVASRRVLSKRIGKPGTGARVLPSLFWKAHIIMRKRAPPKLPRYHLRFLMFEKRQRN